MREVSLEELRELLWLSVTLRDRPTALVLYDLIRKEKARSASPPTATTKSSSYERLLERP